MAKLNITFVNEVGNNLNRYKAIDVNTGDEYLFDLSRNGTITTPGTPLNAEIMNAIVEAINSIDTEKQGQIDTLKNATDKLREDFDNSFTEKSVTRKIRKLVDYPSKELSYPDQNVILKQLGGMSYKYNQLASLNQNITTIYSFTLENNMFHIPSANTWGSGVIRTAENILKNSHKYYVSALVKSTSSSMLVSSTNTYGFIQNSNISSTVFTKIDGIVTIKADSERIFYHNNGTDSAEYYIQPMLVDLTAMYGAGNEPTTVEKFLADYPMYNSYVPYTEGDIINANVTSVDSVGVNIWDEEWGNYLWDETDNGIRKNNNGCFGCEDYIKVLPNTTYYFRSPTSVFYILFYDNDKKYLSHLYSESNITFNTPNNCSYITWYSYNSYGTTYNHDICINVSNDAINGTYFPYNHNNFPIPSSIQSLEGYGWGVNDSCYNYVDFERKKFVKKVGRVDLGTLSWTDYTGALEYPIFWTTIPSLKSKGEIICPNYEKDHTLSSSTKFMSNDGYLGVANEFHIRDTSYTDAATFKAAMSGVYLYYELATPIETDIVALDNYPVWQYGTETQNAILPAIIIKEYSISTLDQIVKNIEVDANQTDMIEKLVENDNSIDNSIKSLKETQDNHSSSIDSLNTKITNLENYKFDSSKLKIEQNLVNTILKYNNVEIDRIENLDVAYLPNIVFDVYQDSQFTAQEKVTITNSTDMDMYVSIKGLKEHNNLSVPFGESVTSQLTASIESSLPNSYIATIEIKIYYNPKTNYNATTGYTVFENVKTINLRATVYTTDR